MADVEPILARLERMGSAENVAGMARFGIVGDDPFGVSVTQLRKIARELGRSHDLALALWATRRHEARILATLVDEPERVTRAQMRAWARELCSWDVTDACAMNLFDRTPFAFEMARAFTARKPEFERRLGFAMMAALASHDKQASDAAFLALLPLVEARAGDERNFVKKAVSWALRGIGKRSARLRRAAVATARRLAAREEPSARWIGKDALRELARA